MLTAIGRAMSGSALNDLMRSGSWVRKCALTYELTKKCQRSFCMIFKPLRANGT